MVQVWWRCPARDQGPVRCSAHDDHLSIACDEADSNHVLLAARVDLVKQHVDLRSFLLDKTRTGMPSGLRVLIHYAIGTVHRATAMAAHIDLKTGTSTPITELIFVPFGYLLTYGVDPPDLRPIEITHYASHGYDDQLAVNMNLRLLCTLSPLPCDYSTPAELEATRAVNERVMAELQKKAR